MYYIAEKKPETGRFVLWQKDGRVHPMTQREVEKNFKLVVRLHGTENVMLLKEVRYSVNINVELREE